MGGGAGSGMRGRERADEEEEAEGETGRRGASGRSLLGRTQMAFPRVRFCLRASVRNTPQHNPGFQRHISLLNHVECRARIRIKWSLWKKRIPYQ